MVHIRVKINLDVKSNDDSLQNLFLMTFFGQRTAELYVFQNS